jgi:hypothetical protein
MMLEEQVSEAMKQAFKDVPFGITHTLRVLKNAEEIMAGEALDGGQAEIARLAALLHDIGAVSRQAPVDGWRHQELEGPAGQADPGKRRGGSAGDGTGVFRVGSHHTRQNRRRTFRCCGCRPAGNLEFGKRPQDADQLRDRIRETFRTATAASLAPVALRVGTATHDNIQSFSQQSDQYARHRPTYPDELFAYLASLSRKRERAWDCATGNGQAALGCATFFEQVAASDLSLEQARHGRPRPGIRYLAGSAEHAPFADGSFDLVMVAQALHWFDLGQFYAERCVCDRAGTGHLELQPVQHPAGNRRNPCQGVVCPSTASAENRLR